jgi:hypothetical protein
MASRNSRENLRNEGADHAPYKKGKTSKGRELRSTTRPVKTAKPSKAASRGPTQG